jgi:rifampicin phosphotransferase
VRISSCPAELPSVAVRSSATAEDLPDLSFAGQQETYLNVHGAEEVIAAVRRCWSSLWTARAISYRMRSQIDQTTVHLAVVVQELVPAESAGVLFTASPLDGRRDLLVINAAWGLGEAIVSGLVTPDTLTVAKADGQIIQRQTAEKQLMTVRVNGATEEQPVPEALRSAEVLDAQAAGELARLGTRIEALYGMPMDIEWARAADTFYILQARPITALPERRSPPAGRLAPAQPQGQVRARLDHRPAARSAHPALPNPGRADDGSQNRRDVRGNYRQARLGLQLL